jgi:hypothetical protein
MVFLKGTSMHGLTEMGLVVGMSLIFAMIF